MQLFRPFLGLALLWVLCHFMSVLAKPLKQTTRQEVVERMQRRQSNPLRPRQSASPCTLPAGGFVEFYTINTYDGVFGYANYGYGSGVTEDVNNPGNTNPNYPPVSTNLGYQKDVPEALLLCAEQTASVQYNSFDLHFLGSQCAWICAQYYGENDDALYFNEENDDVLLVYGYSNGI